MTGNEVRSQFLRYFEKHHHRIVRSSSLVPSDDPTLLFTNAGMVQFKRAFLGEENRGYDRATTSQKCVRAGGKHNDLENVGYTARHHTFFEMLGNFSFGDYFKEKAIEFAWDLLTDGYGFPAEKLWASVYLDDDEAYDLWHKNIGIPEDRIARFGEKDNFWAMGDTGPCGPCSEILIDRGESFGCGKASCKIGCECDRYLEIWNLVFMQFNRDASGEMTPLPKPSIDTGMGLERVISIIQDVNTNYDTDLMLPIIARVEELAQKQVGESRENEVAMKVIADHSRAAAFLIGDGVLPSNEGRGYVLRRIMRRAIRYGRNIGLTKPFMHHTAKKVFEIMKPAYPELMEAEAFITNIIKNEELRFLQTLDHGLRLLNDTLSDLKARGVTQVPGEVVFKLYDTYGFPVDIVRDVTRDEDLSIEMDGFEAAMKIQREQSKTTVSFSEIRDAYRQLTSKGFQPVFVGYDHLSCQTSVQLIVKDGQEVGEAETGDEIEVVTAETPFYGEAGGQVGDCGHINGENLSMRVSNTLKDPTGLIIHKGQVVSGRMRKGDTVELVVDDMRRRAIALNHTATHILHAVLREILGAHVKQAGSLVAQDRFRFDFTHFSQIDPETLDKIECRVNATIRENIPVQTEEMPAEEAFKTGATALFEEKYGDAVRVVSLAGFSKELCGGTHTDATGSIGFFKIVDDTSVASGVRRIEALTGDAAVRAGQQTRRVLLTIAQLMKEKPEALAGRIEKLLKRQKVLEKEVEQYKMKFAAQSTGNVENDVQLINNVRVLSKKVDVQTPSALRELADQIKSRVKSGIIVLGSYSGTKVLLIALVTEDLLGKYHAGKIVKKVAALVGGSGGGRADMAQAGGNQPENLDQALKSVPNFI